MFIVLEGVDGSGKSSLAADLIAEIKARRPHETVVAAHHGQLQRDPLREYVLDDYVDYVPADGTSYVIDRFHWGERVYGPLYRGGSALSTSQFRWVELWMLARGATTWRVTQPLERVQQRLADRGEDFLKPQHVKQVLNAFAEVERSAVTAAGAVEPNGPTDDLVSEIIAAAEYQESRAAGLVKRYPSFIGDPIPHTLLVGDKRGGQPPHPTTSAFLPVNGNSGAFLLDALDDDWWRGIAIINGTEEGDKIPQLVEDLYGPNILALGRNASDVLLDLNVEHGAVPHPAYVRRFHNRRQVEYGRLIRELARTGEVRLSWPN